MPTPLTDPLPGLEARPGGAHYAILDQGAHVLAWQPAGARPVLWTSSRSSFRPGVAVRGGIPIVFPWFGSGPDGDRSPAHGYARITPWERVSASEEGDRFGVQYRLAARLSDRVHDASSEVMAEPSLAFPAADLTVEFSPTDLVVTLAITNEAIESVTVEAALHTYFAVGDIRRVSIEGLDGASYIDTTADDRGPHDQRGPVTFTGRTDRLYASDRTVVLHDPAWERSITIAKSGSGTTVVWNPWSELAAEMADFDDDGWQHMVCIEAAAARDTAITLNPGETHSLAQMINLSALG